MPIQTRPRSAAAMVGPSRVPPKADGSNSSSPALIGHPGRREVARWSGEHNRTIRRAVQSAFLLLNLWIGAQFYLFVRYWETGGQSVFVPRPPGVEGWLPIAGLMNLKVFLG